MFALVLFELCIHTRAMYNIQTSTGLSECVHVVR